MRPALVATLFVAACGGRASPATPSNREPVPPDAPISAGACYPYALRDGACLTKCDWSRPPVEQGCARGDWPLICNSDGTCTPEQRFDDP